MEIVPFSPMLGAAAKVIVNGASRQTPLAPGFGNKLVTDGGRGPSPGPPALPEPPLVTFVPALPAVAFERPPRPTAPPEVAPLPPAPGDGEPPELSPPALFSR